MFYTKIRILFPILVPVKHLYLGLKSFLRYQLFLLFSLSIHRLIFFLFNQDYVTLNVKDFFLGFQFDLSWVAYVGLILLIPYLVIIHCISVRFQPPIIGILFFIPFAIQVLTESWDLVYFRYSLQRSSFDLYSFFIAGPEHFQLGNLTLKFWPILLLVSIWFFIFGVASKRIFLKNLPGYFLTFKNSVGIVLFLFMQFVVARSSFGPKPLGILDATLATTQENVPFVLNSPFVVLKTIQNERIPSIVYLDENTEKSLFNPKKHYNSIEIEWKPNIVFLVLESFGSSQIYNKEKGNSVTPFVDSILSNSWFFENGMANGKTSIESLPAVFAGIPSWLETPFTLSNYCNNSLCSLPKIAKNKGYKSYFFHGARKGSMRFDSFSNSLGFEHYFSMEDEKNKNNFDGAWGIYDHAFLRLMGKELSKSKTPFLSVFFSLSSHEPFNIPKKYESKFKHFSKEQAAYAYTDESLKLFFSEMKNQPWFKETLFVILADHTPVHLDSDALTIQDKHRIPIAFYAPSKLNPNRDPKEISQVDILPTLIKLMNWNTNIYSFGTAFTIHSEKQDQIAHLNGTYFIWNDLYEMQYNETKQKWNVMLKNVNLLNLNDKKEVYLKMENSKKLFLAKLQRFRRDVKMNRIH